MLWRGASNCKCEKGLLALASVESIKLNYWDRVIFYVDKPE
jgi:hypothetical protein